MKLAELCAVATSMEDCACRIKVSCVAASVTCALTANAAAVSVGVAAES